MVNFSFQTMVLVFNTNYKNKLSKVTKSIERWLKDDLKCEKKNNDKVIHCNDIAQLISEISGILCSSSKSRKTTHIR